MQKQITQFKTIINGIENFFHFDQSCPIAIAKEAVLECLKWLGQIEDQAKANAAAQASANSDTPDAVTPPASDLPAEDHAIAKEENKQP